MSHPLGVSRPDLEVTDLPTPEEVFKVSRIGPGQLFKYAVGPSLIALGISAIPPAGAEEPRLWAIALLVLIFLITF